jgi:hypothetical protein
VHKNSVWTSGTPIFGSVTAADVLAKVRESLAKDADTAGIALEESNISFVSRDDEEDPTRLKSLGTYQVSISIPGSENAITTAAEVIPDAASEEALIVAKEEARKAARPVVPKESPGTAFAKSKKTSRPT